MATAQPPAQQPAASSAPPPPAQQPSPTSPTSSSSAPEQQSNPFSTLGQEQIATLLKTLGPSFYQATRPGSDPKDSAVAAEALSNMAQASFPHLPPGVPMYQGQYPPSQPGMEPGPSSHPRGPPNLSGMVSAPPGSSQPPHAVNSDEQDSLDDLSPDGEKQKPGSAGRRAGRSSSMTNDEWARQRKDNHKEVERRRRGNINEGINELGRIVPNGSGEKAKGAILARAVQYIHHLKENEARNIEKWTLEKLLMDQAMGDLQAQLEEVRRMWDEERASRQRLEAELQVLRGLQQNGRAQSPPSRGGSADDRVTPKRSHDEADRDSADDDDERGKRPRVD